MSEWTQFFTDAWRSCLYAHYEHVVQEGDWNNESSLRKVLIRVGMTAEQLDEVILRFRPEHLASEAPDVPPLPEPPVAESGPILVEAVEVIEAAEAVEPEPIDAPPPVPEEPPTPAYSQPDLFAGLGAAPADSAPAPAQSEPPPAPPKGKKAAKPKQMGFF